MAEVRAIFHDLVRLEIELWAAADGVLRAEAGIPVAWFEHMRVIDRRKTCRVVDIVEELRITHGGASKIVTRLVDAGMCTRTLNPSDGRSSHLELTRLGAEKLTEADGLLERILDERITHLLTGPDLERFARTLRDLRSQHHPDGARDDRAGGSEQTDR